MYLIIIIQFLSFYKDQWKLPNKTLINKSWKIFRMDTVSMTESTSMVIKFLPPEKCWVTVSTHGCARQPFIVLSKAARSDWHDGNTNRSRLFNANFKMSFIKSVKLIMFIWKPMPTEAIIELQKLTGRLPDEHNQLDRLYIPLLFYGLRNLCQSQMLLLLSILLLGIYLLR